MIIKIKARQWDGGRTLDMLLSLIRVMRVAKVTLGEDWIFTVDVELDTTTQMETEIIKLLEKYNA